MHMGHCKPNTGNIRLPQVLRNQQQIVWKTNLDMYYNDHKILQINKLQRMVSPSLDEIGRIDDEAIVALPPLESCSIPLNIGRRKYSSSAIQFTSEPS